MIDLLELRIGNYIFNMVSNKPESIQGINTSGDIDVLNIEGIIKKYDMRNFDPLYLNPDMIANLKQKSILHEMNGFYYFKGKTTTYFLVHDKENNDFFIGMIDADLPEKYRRITRPFVSIHKLQNAYYMIYNEELNIIEGLKFLF